ncbi:MAG: PqqD family protein [Candidatus Nanopelagicales bacterium]
MRIPESAVVSLPNSVRLTADGLIDTVLEYEFTLSDTAGQLVRLLLTGQSVGMASSRLADAYAEDPQTVLQDARDLLTTLNRHALLKVHAPLIDRAEIAGYLSRPTVALLYGAGRVLSFEYAEPSARRHDPSLRGVVRGAGPVTAFLLATALLVTALIWWTVRSSGTSIGRALAFSIASPVTATLLVIISIVAHEYGHLRALRGRVRAVVISRGLSLSVAHPRLNRRDGRWVGLAGPLAALAACLFLTILMVLIGTNRYFLTIGLLVGASHIYSLAPWHHDGKMVWTRGRNVV